MVNEKSFITIQAFMVNDLHLKGNELLIYAIIWGFSQDGESEFTGSLQYLADWTSSTKQGVMKALQSLCEKELILKNVEYKNNIRFCTYKTSMVLNKVEQGMQQSLMGYATKFNGGIKQSLPNNINDNINDKLEDNIKVKQTRFIKPSISEIQQYCEERKNTVNAEKFFNHYESNGWYVGKNKMKDWKACVRTWEQNEKKYATSQNGGYVNNRRPASDSVGCDVDF